VSEKTELHFDKVNIVEFSKNNKTPFYIFGEGILNSNLETLLDSTEQNFLDYKVQLAYSVKNNTIPKLLSNISEKGFFFEVTSFGEMKLLKNIGVPLSRCIYTNIWKPKAVIQYAIENGLGYFAIDSISDLNQVSKVTHEMNVTVQVLVRVNPAITMHNTVFASSVPNSKTGVEIVPVSQEKEYYENAYTLCLLCENDPLIELKGIHGHIGSQVVDLEYYKEYSRIICEFYKLVENRLGKKMDILDLGGGIPVPYRSQKEVPLPNEIMRIIKTNIEKSKIRPKLMFEIGRYITSSAGILVTSIVSIKKSPQIGTIIVTDASAYNELLDSVLVHWNFDMTIANKINLSKDNKVWVVGSTTDSIDAYDPKINSVSNRDRYLQFPEEGDLLVIINAGAYTTSFNMNYCLRPIIPVFWINQNKHVIFARRKQLIEEMYLLYEFSDL